MLLCHPTTASSCNDLPSDPQPTPGQRQTLLQVRSAMDRKCLATCFGNGPLCLHTHTHTRARARARAHTHTHTHTHTHPKQKSPSSKPPPPPPTKKKTKTFPKELSSLSFIKQKGDKVSSKCEIIMVNHGSVSPCVCATDVAVQSWCRLLSTPSPPHPPPPSLPYPTWHVLNPSPPPPSLSLSLAVSLLPPLSLSLFLCVCVGVGGCVCVPTPPPPPPSLSAYSPPPSLCLMLNGARRVWGQQCRRWRALWVDDTLQKQKQHSQPANQTSFHHSYGNRPHETGTAALGLSAIEGCSSLLVLHCIEL